MTIGKTNTILLLTGSLVSAKDRSLWQVVRKQLTQRKHARHAWLEAKIKAVAAEPLLAAQQQSKTKDPIVANYFNQPTNPDPPELTAVVLATLLEQEGLPFEVAAYDDLFSQPEKIEQQLQRTTIVFASTTLLHDLSELTPLIQKIKRPHNKIILGGALAGELCHHWEGMPEVDLLAVGYGERLVPALANWIRSDFEKLTPPEGGRLERKQQMDILYSGVPESKNLDHLTTPDWQLAELVFGQSFALIHYESVRGCPYRCSFCNYPYLFDDTKFRYKSAEKIASDWAHYAKTTGVQYISCLDSLFTLPKKRLVELCQRLIDLQLDLKWGCYARADDLLDEATVQLMQQAGCHQVQIGVESGDATILANMNKKCTVESNEQALRNCRKYGITTVVSVIVGFPGETAATVEKTFQSLKASPPDFFFIATFSTRVEGVPVLNPANRQRYGLWTMSNTNTMAPYWQHDTMSCTEVGNHVRQLGKRLRKEKVALDASIFYNGILQYKPQQREALLTYQHRIEIRHPILNWVFDRFNYWIDRRLKEDMQLVGSASDAIDEAALTGMQSYPA